QWHTECLPAQTSFYLGLPNPGQFFGAASAARYSGNDAKKYNLGLQIAPGPLDSQFPNKYRSGLAEYRLTRDTWVASSTAKRNPTWGDGGLRQYFISGGDENPNVGGPYGYRSMQDVEAVGNQRR